MIRLEINPDAFESAYEQVKTRLARMLKRGDVRPGKRLPTVRQIALDLELNANEVTRICQRLTAEGYLDRKAGMGVFGVGSPAECADGDQERRAVFDV